MNVDLGNGNLAILSTPLEVNHPCPCWKRVERGIQWVFNFQLMGKKYRDNLIVNQSVNGGAYLARICF